MHGTMVKRTAVDMRWTEAEDDIIRQFTPDHAELALRLPHRSKQAIHTRVRVLNAAVRQCDSPVTAREEKRIKQLSECFSSVDVIASIMGRNANTIRSILERRRWPMKKARPKPTGSRLYDEVRERAFDMNISFRDLDRDLAYRSRFFSSLAQVKDVSIGMIAKAVEALGGRLVIEWEPLDEEESP